MELEANITVVTKLELTNTLAKYNPLVKHLAKLVVQKRYEEIVENNNKLIEIIAMDITSSKDVILPQLRVLLSDCLKINKQNYQACFNSVFQKLIQGPNSQQHLMTYFKNKLMQAKTHINKKNYLQAIDLSAALNCWFTEALQEQDEYRFLWETLLTQCDNVYESVYFHWLHLDIMHFIDYQYPQYELKVKVLKYINNIEKYTIKQNYQNCTMLCTDFIQQLTSVSSQAELTSSTLLSVWHKVVMFQRQQSAFAWLISDYLNFSQQSEFINMLNQDLSILAKLSYFSKSVAQELYCKQGIMDLLTCPSMDHQTLKELRDRFCLAFDIFYEKQENHNTALTLLGLGLINTYEGDKPAMLDGFKFAADYDTSLKALIRVIIQQLPYHIYPIENVKLANPFICASSMQATNVPTLSLN